VGKDTDVLNERDFHVVLYLWNSWAGCGNIFVL
jgi:hypothetical protein